MYFNIEGKKSIRDFKGGIELEELNSMPWLKETH